jgi:transposase
MTFLAALRHDRIDAPWFIEGPIDGVSFRIYVEKVLLPTLRPGDIVVLDNLGSHRSKAVRQLIRSAGAKLFFLPKYSPIVSPAWCNWRWGTAFAGKSRAGQLAIAGRLTLGSSLNGAMVSSVM